MFVVLAILIVSYACTYAASSDSLLFLIPQPQKIEIKGGSYNLRNLYSAKAINTSQFYLQQVEDAITKKFKANAASGINAVRLIKADSSDFDDMIRNENFKPPFDLGDEGYILSVSPVNIVIIAKGNAGVFYGVQTLLQLINANTTGNTIPCLVIYDKPDMSIRGWQDDISRGPIPTLDFLKKEIRTMASFKLNTFTLYTEHTFKLRKHPAIAPADGITAEEIKELTTFAKDYHVDIIGNFQSFGHFKKILEVPGYEHLGENEHTLSPAKEESYKFLEEVYSEIVPAYSSKYFHINCDEVSLGTGPSKNMIDSIGKDGVYAYHINRIDSLLKPYKKRIMMWGDIAVHNPKIIDRLPKNMIIVSWGYAEMESMDEDILPFVKSGFDFIVAPGVSCWMRVYPDLERASINIYNFLRDGYKNNALGFINTTWDDDGQNLFNNNWYSLVWGADCGWSAPENNTVKESEAVRKSRVASFNRAYNRIYFNTEKDITSLMLSVSGLRYGPVKNCLSNSSLWNPLLPDYEIIPENYERDNLNLLKTIDSLYAVADRMYHVERTVSMTYANLTFDYAKGNTDKIAELELLLFALRQARVIANKNLLGIRLKENVQSGKVTHIYFENNFKSLSDTIKELKPVYGKLWLLENRNWWLDTVYSYYDSFSEKLNDLQGVCIIKAADKPTNGKREINLRSAVNSLPVYYTTDGTTPTIYSTKYTEPIYTDSNLYIRARVIDNGKMYKVESDSFVFHKGIGALHQINSRWNTDNAAWAARGELGLLDGRRGSKNNFNDGRWQAYVGNHLDIELDLGKTTTLSQVSIGFAQLMRYGILYPQQIEISTSPDGDNFTLTKTEVNTISPNTVERSTHDYIISLHGTITRYLKIVARNTAVLPEWHYAKRKQASLFADEIIVK